MQSAVRRPASPAAIRWWTIAGLLVLWEAAARLFGDPAFVAPPSLVIMTLPALLGDPKVAAAVGTAVLEIIAAFVLAVVVGATLGTLIGLTTLGRRAFFPFVLLLFGLPQVVLLPLVILMFGLGHASRIAFGFTHGVLPIMVTTITGMRTVSPLLLASARSQGATQSQVLRHIIFPTMVATVFTGLRLAMSLTLLGVVLAELFVSTNGIGNYTQIFAETFKPGKLYGLIFVLAFAAVALNEIVGLVEKRFSRWKQG